MLRAALAMCLATAACERCGSSSVPGDAQAEDRSDSERSGSGLARNEPKPEDTVPGDGGVVGPGQIAVLHYRLTRSDGGVVSELKEDKPGFQLAVGRGFAMPGLERLAPGMKVRGVRTLAAPAEVLLGPHLPPGVEARDLLVLKVTIDDIIFLIEP